MTAEIQTEEANPETPQETVEVVTPPVEPETPVAVEPETPVAVEPETPVAVEPETPLEYKFQTPEGSELDPDMATKYEGVARELGIKPEAAQKLLDLAIENNLNASAKAEKEWQAQRETWVDSIRNDKEFGGTKLTETVTRAKRMLDKFGSPDLVQVLDKTGLGDNADLIRLLAKMSKAIGEDLPVEGDAAVRKYEDAASLLYPNQK